MLQVRHWNHSDNHDNGEVLKMSESEVGHTYQDTEETRCPTCHTLGEMRSCVQCSRPFFVADWELEIGEPKICSEKCAKEWSH